MKAPIYKLRRIIQTLQDIVDIAEDRGVTEVETNCNTYGLHEFVSLGSDGFLDLNADVDDLFEDPESDDDMN